MSICAICVTLSNLTLKALKPQKYLFEAYLFCAFCDFCVTFSNLTLKALKPQKYLFEANLFCDFCDFCVTYKAFIPVNIRQSPNVNALASTFWNPAKRSISHTLSGFGKFNTELGRYL